MDPQAFLAAIMDSSSDAIYSGDLHGVILTWNRGAEQLFGYRADEIIGRHVSVLFPSGCDEDGRSLLDALYTGSPPARFETRRRHKDGREIAVALTSSPIRDGRGEVVAVFAIARDMTARVAIEEELRRSQERFERVFRSAPVGIIVSDASEQRLLEVNEEGARIFGYSRDEVVGRTTIELGIWEHQEQRDRLFARLLEKGELRDIEMPMRGREGRPLVVRASFQLTTVEGRPLVLSAFVDVTAELKTQEALLRSEQKFITVFNESPVPLAVSEYETGRFLEVNRALLEMMRASVFEQMVGHTSVEIGMVTPSVRRDLIVGSLAEGRSPAIPVPMRRLDGEPFMAELSLSSYEEGGKRYLLTCIVDISERLRTQAQYRELVEGVRDVVFALDGRGIITSLNPAFERITGLHSGDWVGKPFIDLLHPDDVGRAKRLLSDALRGNTAELLPLRIRTASGAYRFGEVHATPRMEDGRVVGFLGIGRDVTERVDLEERFRQSQKMEAIGNLAGGVAHDFNNLLSVVLSHAGMLRGEMPEREELKEIEQAGMRAAELTRQLLAFSRRQILRPRVVDLNQVIAGMESMLRRLIGEDVELHVVRSAQPAAVSVDPGQMEQVLMNLAVNARDAMPRGGAITIEVAEAVLDEARVASLPGLSPGPHVALSVSDTGAGMDAATKARIFEPFFTTKEVGKGTGLGLSTVFGIVQQSAGAIAVESEKGKGARFTIWLPAAGEAPLSKCPKAAEQADRRGTETILLVEDEAGVRRVVRSMLEKHGYRVLEAQNGGEAILIAESAAVDLLLTDVVMPLMSGPQLCERLRAARPELKALFMSGYTDNAVLRHGLEGAELTFVQKPITPAALLARVREALDAPRGAPQRAGPAAKTRVLVVDDEPLMQRLLKQMLRDCAVQVAGSAREGLSLIERGTEFDVLLCDLNMQGMSGIEFYRSLPPALRDRLLLVTGGATSEEASRFIAGLPGQVLQKPVDANTLRSAVSSRASRR
ncbi:MAG TPA: PAS domain S-box protein [Myxococcales bacterium]|nr:PAS domain S-box protein [Myxococcales bacterium]